MKLSDTILTTNKIIGWDEPLPGLKHAYNSSVHATTGLAPFMMMFGQIPRCTADILIQPSYNSVESVSEFVLRMQEMVSNGVSPSNRRIRLQRGMLTY
jgi:hypothetical protein